MGIIHKRFNQINQVYKGNILNKNHIFREYDIRGIFEQDLNQDIVYKIGYCIAQILKDNQESTINIGYDARVHSPILFQWLSNGFLSAGIKVNDLGLIPTPVAYFSTFNSNIKSSIMITGSHNPAQYNGFKITLNNAPFYGESIQNLKHSINALNLPYQEHHTQIPKIQALQDYITYLAKHFSSLQNFPYPIAIDCGNGVAGVALEPILQALNLQYTALFSEPDGTFPNHHPDPSEEKNLSDLKNLMQSQNLPIGLAFDGDADRIALLSQDSSRLYSYKGDELAILFARAIAKEIAPRKPIIIGEVKCSSIMYDECNKIGSSIMYKTGHSNLKVKLKELDASLAAEMSGHIFFNDRYFGYDDAIYAGLRALELFLSSTPTQIQDQILSLPALISTPEEKIPTQEESKFTIIKALEQKLANPPADFPLIQDIITIDGIRIIFERGWGLVRASNTTPVLVTRFEAQSQELLELYKSKTLALLQSL